MTFADLGVPAHLCAALSARGITAPFPIQAATLPDALAGRDVCGKAPTGSGKTLAFGLAIALRSSGVRPGRPAALVLVPTRELASQVRDEIAGLMGTKGRSVIAVYGGAGYTPQRRSVARGVSVIVACPGRLQDMVDRNDVDLSTVSLVVVDEADRMADMGFLPAVKKLLDLTSPERQTLLFSATLDGEIDSLVRRYQHNPARHEVAGGDEELSDRVAHAFWQVDRSQRVNLTAQLVAHHGQTIVFCRTRRGAERIARQLADTGISTVAIHGDRSQGQRERALDAFTRGRVQALVATDVAARGIHVDGIGCVVHFDPPADAKDYKHRSGRTGRAGATGTVVSLVADDNRSAVRTLQRHLGFEAHLTSPDVTSEARHPSAPVSTGPDRSESAPRRTSRGRGGNGGGYGRPGGSGRPGGNGRPGGRPAGNGASNGRPGARAGSGGGRGRRS